MYWWGGYTSVSLESLPKMDLGGSDYQILTAKEAIIPGFILAFFVFGIVYLLYQSENTINKLSQKNVTLFLILTLTCLWFLFSFKKIYLGSVLCFTTIIYWSFMLLNGNQIFDRIKENIVQFFVLHRVRFITMAMLIALVFQYYFILLYLIVFVLLSGLKKNSNTILGSLNNDLEANTRVRNYHRKNDFPLLYHIINVLQFSLLTSFIYMAKINTNFSIAGSEKSLYLQNWYKLLFFIIGLNAVYNLYIMLFSNPKFPKQFLEFCSFCAKGVSTIVFGCAAGEETGALEPTAVGTYSRKVLGGTVFHSTEQRQYYRALKSNTNLTGTEPFDSMVLFKKKQGWRDLFKLPETESFPDSGERLPENYGLSSEDYVYKGTYKEFSPEEARRLATDHSDTIRQTASDEQMEILYPEDRRRPTMSTQHNVNVALGASTGFSRKK
jgi:hypothetical protein